jgi:hypothetical protein
MVVPSSFASELTMAFQTRVVVAAAFAAIVALSPPARAANNVAPAIIGGLIGIGIGAAIAGSTPPPPAYGYYQPPPAYYPPPAAYYQPPPAYYAPPPPAVYYGYR